MALALTTPSTNLQPARCLLNILSTLHCKWFVMMDSYGHSATDASTFSVSHMLLDAAAFVLATFIPRVQKSSRNWKILACNWKEDALNESRVISNCKYAC